MNGLIADYKKKRQKIKKRLREFKTLQKRGDEEIFAELCFCLMTPQSKASSCDRAVRILKVSRLLLRGGIRDIRKVLRGSVRFHNKKSSYLITARRLFTSAGTIDIKRILKKDAFTAREWLVKHVKGLGFKEASHFLRNIGMGDDLAILDVHILRNLKRYGVIRKIPASLTKDRYIAVEEKMRVFSERVKIPLPEIDLLFWSNQTGFIFK